MRITAGIVRNRCLTPEKIGTEVRSLSCGYEEKINSAPFPNTVMPWVAFAGMTDRDLGAIWAFLQTLPPQPTSQPIDYGF